MHVTVIGDITDNIRRRYSMTRLTIPRFNTIVSGNVFAPAGFNLPPDDYVLENVGDMGLDFVLYIVDRTAPHFGSSVYVPQQNLGVAIKDRARFVTILSSFEAMWFSGFTGTFPEGFPRIYATGFDAAGDDMCNPVFQARSQHHAEKSWPTIPTAVLTVDFGFIGAHNVTVNRRKAKQPMKNGAVTTVYTSPGYVGCLFNSGQNYNSPVSNVEDSFAVISESLGINIVYDSLNANEALHFRVNDNNYNWAGGTYTSFSKYFGAGSFDVDLAWTRNTISSSWALQLDFGVEQPAAQTTTARSLSATPQITTQSVSLGTEYTKSTKRGDWSTTSTSRRSYTLFSAIVLVCIFA
ncbi:hypothetical protein PMAYCL1PPCAC_00835 [Pristionchus mayeri]|uniref:Uncharacterized protein n=1 Tax=Pristionchus mayeri TaxID=1317129 RepID=A0AAN4Z3L4_9BILA|nr:hypothetical protein PMAYCL1PPCAC_00835 [Pristionchus mayeri]